MSHVLLNSAVAMLVSYLSCSYTYMLEAEYGDYQTLNQEAERRKALGGTDLPSFVCSRDGDPSKNRIRRFLQNGDQKGQGSEPMPSATYSSP